MKKSISILMCFTILISTLVFTQTSASAESYTSGDFEYEILDDGTAEITDYNGSATSLVIPSKINGYTVTSIGYFAFSDCTSLESITIPDSVKSIGQYAFNSCTSLISITIPDSVTSIGDWAFYNCSALSSITIGEGVTSIGDDVFYNTAYFNNQSNWEDNVLYIGNYLISGKYQIYNEDTWDYETVFEATGTYSIKEGTKTIADYAFSSCKSITSITIPNSVTSIGTSAFEICTALESITMPDSVTSIGNWAFFGCSALSSITIGEGVTSIGNDVFYLTAYFNNQSNWVDNVLYIGNYLISGSRQIYNEDTWDYETIEVSGSYSIKEGTTVIADEAFYGCTALTSVTIPDSVTSIGDYAFCNCTALTSVTIPDSVTSIDDWAFCNCTALSSITIGEGVTSIGDDVFYNTAYFNNESNWVDNVLYIGNYLIKANDTISGAYSIKEGTKVIADYAFRDCFSLTSVTIPDSVASIGNYVFFNCIALTSITIPNTVTSISDWAFGSCTALSDVYYLGTQDQWNNITIGNNNNNLTLANIHVYTVKIDGVAVATYGSEFTFPVSTAKGFVAYTDNTNYYDVGDKVTIDKNLEFTTIAIGEVKMLEGASIRLAQKSGIRFETQVDTTKISALPSGATVEKGTLITLKELATSDLTLDSIYQKVDVKYLADEYRENGTFAGSLVNIKEKNIAKEFVGRGYVKVTVGNITKTIYAEYANGDIANNTRSVAFIANAYKTNSADLYYNLEKAYKDLVDKWASKIG